MHLGRFHRLIELLHVDCKTLKPVQLIQEVETSLNNVASNPGNAEIANAYKVSLEKCREILGSSSFNTPRPILKNMLESIDAEKHLGNALFEQVIKTISLNPAAPSLAAQALSLLRQETETFFHHIENIDNSFTHLKVEYEVLGEGEAEIGLLIPRDKSSSTLKDLSKEFNQWNNALTPIAELFDPSAPPMQIKQCATTDWMFYLAASPPILYGLSKCVKGVNGILIELIETRSLIEKLIEKKQNPKAIETLQTDQEVAAKNKLRELAEQTVDEEYKGADEGRKNELKNAMTQSMTTIAEKVSDGAKIEVCMLPPKIEVKEENAQSGQDIEALTWLQNLAKSLDDDVDALIFNGEANTVKALLGQSEDNQ